MAKLLIESVACSADDCVEAEAGGADRLELCSALMLGGLTPSLGTLVEARAATALPIVSMIRPRAGGFCYTAREFRTMLRDAALAAAEGMQGIVFGVLTEDGRIDEPRCRKLIASAPSLQTVFHRAFDVVPDPSAALETLVQLGVTRVLTSGRERTALAGAPVIRELARLARGRIDVLPGGGIRAETVADVLAATGLPQVHLGPFTHRKDPSGQANPDLTFSSHTVPPEGQYALVDREALRRLRSAAAGV